MPLGIIQAVQKIVETVDKWFSKTPEQKVKDDIRDQARQTQEIGDAIEKASKGKVEDLEHIINK